MKKTLFVLRSVEDFAPGAFENTAMENGSIQLGRSGMAYLPSGAYTSPAFKMAPFLRLVPSWNADTPVGTAVEVQVRVAAGGQWSRWFSFGRWSPFVDRASAAAQSDELARVEREFLSVAEAHAPADTAQVRIYLYSDNSSSSPQVRVLALAVDPLHWEETEPERSGPVLELPRYSCLVRDPAIAQRIPSATTMAMLMNRWGEDVLPEEVARAGYDAMAGRYGNLSFLTAVAGAYGYACHAQFTGLQLLRREIRQGNAVAAYVQYRTQIMPEGEEVAERHSAAALPALEGAVLDSNGHLVAVRGFVEENGEEYAVCNDPLALADAEVEKKIPIAVFKEIYTGLALFLRHGLKGAGTAKPARVVAELMVQQRELKLMRHGRVLFPGQISLDEVGGITVCYTLPENIVFASATQKKFYYLNLNEKGAFGFDRAAAAGQKISFYLIGSFGRTWVAEKLIPREEVAQSSEEVADSENV